mmetsp:Transcript_40573/g.87080  ORF Transcript_40573/g.87080 Transcript_40573/m.87080 type:complete len:455 (+) Transcript_40573:164-1528(+)
MGHGASHESGLENFLEKLNGGDLDTALAALVQRQRRLKWEALPTRIILIRHGESEGNVNRDIYTTKGDAHLELTPTGLQQAKDAGARLQGLVGDDRMFVVVSPFERTQQTLLGMYRGGLPESQVGVVHVSPQIREQEFGNFQHIGLHEAARVQQAIVGRFYYRRPNAESSADVYDRVSSFWDVLLDDTLPKTASENLRTCLIVTHGLTMRLVLMKLFQWSVETFETVWNVGNCEHVTLTKNMTKMCYQFDKKQSYPSKVCWATRPIWIVLRSKKASDETEKRLAMLQKLKEQNNWNLVEEVAAQEAEHHTEGHKHDEHGHEVAGKWLEIDRVIDQVENTRMKERSLPYTVLDYLTLPQPRTMQRAALDGRLIPGHDPKSCEEALELAKRTQPIDWQDVEFVDWWGNQMSYQGKMLRGRKQVENPGDEPKCRPLLFRHLSEVEEFESPTRGQRVG